MGLSSSFVTSGASVKQLRSKVDCSPGLDESLPMVRLENDWREKEEWKGIILTSAQLMPDLTKALKEKDQP